MAFNIAVKRSSLLRTFNGSLVPSVSINTDNLRVIEKPSLSSAKRGTGYRSSFNGIVCTVFGATGFIGENLINRLGKYGTQIVIPHRCAWNNIMHLRTSADLGQIQFCDFHLEDEDSIRKAIKYSDVVINLIGKENDTWNFSFEKVHVDGARRIAKICREMGVKKFIHTSALNASPNPPEIMMKGGSRFLKTKWYGEEAVREEFPDAVIIRPSEVFGDCDRYFSYYGMNRKIPFRVLYLHNEGLTTIKQPVYVGDVVTGLWELVRRPLKDVIGKTYQFVGPRRYVLNELLYYIFVHMEKDKEYFGLRIRDSRCDLFFRMYMNILDKMYVVNPKYWMTLDRFERDNLTDDFDEKLPNLRDLDVELNNIENHVWGNTEVFRGQRDYVLDVSEFKPPPPPRVIQQI